MNLSNMVYRIIFHNHGKVYEVYAKHVNPNGEQMYGFLEITELLFGQKNSLVLDPSEERLKAEFENVESSFLPLHSIIRIDQVCKEGIAKIHEVVLKDNIHPFPSMLLTPDPTSNE